MDPSTPSILDSEESVLLPLDASTAPTTPEGSLSFSPVLGPRQDLTTATAALPMATVVRNICCVGAGYVGGPTASVVAFQNPHIRVTVVDNNKERIRRWNSHHVPIYEPGLNEIVRIARDGSRECSFPTEPAKLDAFDSASTNSTSSSECNSQCGECREPFTTVAARQPNLFFTTDVAKSIGEADVVLIAVNTPTKTRGAGAGSATDMAAFESVTATVAKHARPGAILVEKSTVPCRTAQLVLDTLSHHRPGVHFEVLSNPEFLAAGTAVTDLLAPDRILIGSSPTPSGLRAAEALASVYATWIPRSRIITTNVFSSELAKLVANSMLAQRISSINSIAAVCEKTGADVDEVAKAIGADPRIGSKFLKAGIGFGGSCFKKDVLSLVYLAESLNLPEVGDYWRAVITMNEYARDRFVSRVVRCLNNTLSGKKATVLGYAFKKDTNDTRESPALEIIRTLAQEGPRELAVFDPCCIPENTRQEIRQFLGPGLLKSEGGPVEVYADAYEACKQSQALLITTDFDEFKYSRPSESPKPLTDGPGGLSAASPLVSPPTRGAVPPAKASRSTKKASAGNNDPRPFERLEPSEDDWLALHKYLVKTSTALGVADPKDPLGRFQPMPACPEDCPDCRTERANGGNAGYGAGEEYKPKEALDWARVGYYMQEPKWVFDGRGVLDVVGMSKLGFRVESVGRQGR